MMQKERASLMSSAMGRGYIPKDGPDNFDIGIYAFACGAIFRVVGYPRGMPDAISAETRRACTPP